MRAKLLLAMLLTSALTPVPVPVPALAESTPTPDPVINRPVF